VKSGQGVGLLGAILALRPELPQPHLPPLADDGLGDQAPEHLLTRRIEPVRRQGADHGPPDPPLSPIEVPRSWRPALTWKQRDHRQRSFRLATASHWDAISMNLPPIARNRPELQAKQPGPARIGIFHE
jgi:hypothetical protein